MGKRLKGTPPPRLRRKENARKGSASAPPRTRRYRPDIVLRIGRIVEVQLHSTAKLTAGLTGRQTVPPHRSTPRQSDFPFRSGDTRLLRTYEEGKGIHFSCHVKLTGRRIAVCISFCSAAPSFGAAVSSVVFYCGGCDSGTRRYGRKLGVPLLARIDKKAR